MNLKNYTFLMMICSILVELVTSAGLCGNGVINNPEECDDGNSNNNDGCSTLCKVQPYYRCDSSTPSLCRIDSLITLTMLGNHRSTSSNTVTFLFKLNEQFALYSNIDFHSIFTTTIPSSQITLQYTYNTNILSTTIQYTQDIENTQQSFQLKLASTPYFWFDSDRLTQELHGVNCQLTFQNDLWMHNIMVYVVIGMVVIVIGIGIVSIFYEKWIGLELIQTYQSVFFMFLLMQEYPFEFLAINQGLRYANGYDDIIAPDYNRTYSLSNALHGIDIQKEFVINFNIGLGLLVLNAIILAGLALRKVWLRYRLQSQISRSLKKDLEKTNKYFAFMFGQVFIMLVLTLMFKIIVVFIVQLSSQTPSLNYLSDDINISLALVSFLILFSVIIYIINWYIMIPDNLNQSQNHLSLQFRNMKLCYPVIYIIYQSLYISIIAIYYRYDYSVYIALSLQIAYFLLMLLVWPYNTPRKINRMLHNVSILYNQFISIFLSFIVLRWRVLLSGELQVKSDFQFKLYTFVFLGLLILATVLTVIRLAIFDKEVHCCERQGDPQQEKDIEQMKPFQKDDLTRFISRQRKRSRKQSLLLEQPKPINSSKNQEEQLISNQILDKFLNEKYITWSKNNLLDTQLNKSRLRMKNIKKTIGSKQAELIKSPLQQLLGLKNTHQENVDAIRD